MINQEDLFDRIDQYLAGEMVPEEKELFEQEMAGDPELANEVELHRNFIRSFRSYAVARLREDLSKLDRELDDPGPSFTD